MIEDLYKDLLERKRIKNEFSNNQRIEISPLYKQAKHILDKARDDDPVGDAISKAYKDAVMMGSGFICVSYTNDGFEMKNIPNEQVIIYPEENNDD